MTTKLVTPKMMTEEEWLRFRIDWKESATQDEMVRVKDSILSDHDKMVYEAGVRRGYVIASDTLKIHNFVVVDREDE